MTRPFWFNNETGRWEGDIPNRPRLRHMSGHEITHEEYHSLVREKFRRESEQRTAATRRREQREKETEDGTLTRDTWISFLAYCGGCCLRCGIYWQDAARTYNWIRMDHIRPLSRGGTHTIANVQPLCNRCNNHKASDEIDYRSPQQAAHARMMHDYYLSDYYLGLSDEFPWPSEDIAS